MFDPKSPDIYPQNENGKPEYASILLTFDPKLARPDHHAVQKVVMSTQSMAESLTSLFDYYKQHEIMHRARTIELIQESGRAEAPVFVYIPGEPFTGIVQVIISTPVWVGLTDAPAWGQGSMLLAVEKMEETVAQFCQDMLKERGGVSNLFFFDCVASDEAEELDRQQQEREFPKEPVEAAGDEAQSAGQ